MARLAALVAAAALALTACTAPATTTPPDGERATSPSPAPPPVHRPEIRLPDAGTTVLPGDDAADLALATSATFFTSAPVAVVAPADDLDAQLRGASVAVALGMPLLVDSPEADAGTEAPADDGAASEEETPAAARPVDEELSRLGVRAVLTLGRVSVDADVPVLPVPDDDAALAVLLGQELPTLPVEPSDAPDSARVPVRAVVGLDRAEPALLVPTGPEPASDEAPATEAAPESTAGPGPTATQDPGRATATPAATAQTTPTEDPRATPAPERPADLPLTEHGETPEGGLVLTTGDVSELAAVATARAAGLDVLTVASGDPRRRSTHVQAIAEAAPTTIIGLGNGFGDDETLAWKSATAATGTELPGGGQVLFPGRRMIAMYGTPSYSGLGMLGEQGLEESLRRAKGRAAVYEEFTDDVVVPAFEIIVTVAAASAGQDGNYSNELPVESFVPWVERALEEGVYVVIDLQPGRTDFLTQAKEYEELLLYPNVGLALDPEWRLEPDQVHLRQIGSVHIDEVNEVVEYLADLTREHALPQKLLILHQFSLGMIQDRGRLDTSRDELAVMIHADGQGSQPAKQDTWQALRRNAPEGVWWGWKNFVDEDSPMLSSEETFTQVQPKPHFVSYQ